MYRFLFCAALCAVCFMSIFGIFKPIEAQISGGISAQSGSSIVMTPRFPNPGDTVRLELNDYSLNTAGASFIWLVDGVEQVNARNERVITLTTSPQSASTMVVVQTKLANGVTIETRLTIAPTRVDLLVEADTLTPPFYAGRAIPSSGSLTRVTAIPFTKSGRTPESYSYLWRVGDDVIGGGSRVGKNSISFRSKFERNVEVSVDVIDKDGSVITSKTIYVPITDPQLYFYEVNPLEGIEEEALSQQYIFTGEEISVRAEPYFVDTTLMAQNPFIQWKLDGLTIDNQNTDRQEITLRREGNQGSFTLEFHVRNLAQLLQGVKDSISLTF